MLLGFIVTSNMTTLLGDESIKLLSNAGMNVGIDWGKVVSFPVEIVTVKEESDGDDSSN